MYPQGSYSKGILPATECYYRSRSPVFESEGQRGRIAFNLTHGRVLRNDNYDNKDRNIDYNTVRVSQKFHGHGNFEIRKFNISTCGSNKISGWSLVTIIF